VAFLIYDVASMPATRYNIWWNGYHVRNPGVSHALEPMVMVDSGNQAFAGEADYEIYYKDMIKAALRRGPKAALHATYEQVGQSILFSVEVKNLSGETLAYDTNNTAVHAFVYWIKPAGAVTTNLLTTISCPIQLLEPNQTATYTLQTPGLSLANWDDLHYLTLVDYVPADGQGAYDMLQAMEAVKK
jgi:hypothetical protein